MILPSFTMTYLFLTYDVTYVHWLASHRTSSIYFPIENGTVTCLVTFTSPLSFSHCNLYDLACLRVHKFRLLTRVVLQTLTQLPLSIIKLHTLVCA
jgi:hypothetical protein